MSPWLSPTHNKIWFGILIANIVLALPFALGYYYFRSKLNDVDTGLTEVQTLANAAENGTKNDSNHSR